MLNSKIGVENPTAKNAKMLHNLQMLDGFANCQEDYEWTYLDKIKIKQRDFPLSKPTHIDRLF